MIQALYKTWAAMAPLLADHVWQSTLFAGVVGLLALVLRDNRARVRCWLWRIASLKFLLPFSLVVGIASHLPWPAPPPPHHEMKIVLEQFGQPFSLAASVAPAKAGPAPFSATGLAALLLFLVWLGGCAAVLISFWVRWRLISAAVREGRAVQSGLEVERLLALKQILGIKRPIKMISTTSALEPGIYGLLHSILVLPADVSERLTEAQWRAVVAHELCHVRRRDNLLATFHMLVEALFWFHPVIWWIGARLIDEREHACDEEVLRLGNDPQTYAEGILKVCKFYLESPLASVAGITGRNLKKRIEAIMTRRNKSKLNLAKRLLLTATAVVAVGGPIVIGVMNAPQGRAQSETGATIPAFAATSVKLSAANDHHKSWNDPPPCAPDSEFSCGEFSAKNVELLNLVQYAYGATAYQVSGIVPDSQKYDVVGTMPPQANADNLGRMLQSLLVDRFKLKAHWETRTMPVYALAVANHGAKFHGAEPGADDTLSAGRSHIRSRQITMSQLASALSVGFGDLALAQPPTDRPVLDKTGLVGFFDIDLNWRPSGQPIGRQENEPPVDPQGPSIFTAVEQQLGLRLESKIASVQVLVIDHYEKPTGENWSK